jgi:hypothetical protein
MKFQVFHWDAIASAARDDWYRNESLLQGCANCLTGDADEVSRQIERAQELALVEMWQQFG